MKATKLMGFGCLAGLLAGCSSSTYTNRKQPGPAVGYAVGVGTGAVVGNTAGAVVAGGQGMADATRSVFTPETKRVVRRWHLEATPDGRTISVPEDYLVDGYGREISKLSK